MLFIAENELEKALVAAVKDWTAAPDFYRLLLETDLLVLGTVEGQENASEKVSLTPGGKLNLVPGFKDGSRYLPVFSSLVRMQEFVEQESKYLSINGRALLEITRGAPVTLNPASQYGKELSPAEVQQLLAGVPLQRPIRTIAGEAEYPAQLVQALTRLFSARPDI
ncbi:MAG TPA: SseB family protein, partial [Rhizomicrobium sp.]|nr:SseB family protein [Rhizomicrobium sp.]